MGNVRFWPDSEVPGDIPEKFNQVTESDPTGKYSILD